MWVICVSQLTASGGFPVGLPPAIQSPAAWLGPDLVASGGLIAHLTDSELRELEATTAPWLARAEVDPAALNDLTPVNFPLLTLANR